MTVAREIMEKQVVTVTADSSLLSVYRLFAETDISGAPVVEQTGEVVGVVSWRDLLRAVNEDHDKSVDDLHFYSNDSTLGYREFLSEGEEIEERLARQTVSEVMTTDVITVPVDATVEQMAGLMVEHRIHRVLVVDEKREEGPLVGIVSVLDLVALLR